MYCRATKTFFKATEGIPAYNVKGEKHLYSIYAKFFICKECGKRLVREPNEKDFLRDSENTICKICETRFLYAKCEDCGCLIKFGTSHKVQYKDKTKLLCFDCFSNYEKCDDCQKFFKKTELEEIDRHGAYDGEPIKTKICPECRKEYKVCNHCGYLEKDMTITEDGYQICDFCQVEIKTCECCGKIYYRNRYRIQSNDKEFYMCNECKNEGTRNIRNYMYKPKAIKHGKQRQKEYFGFEIEVTGSERFAKYFAEHFGDTEEKDIYIKHDGSVAGFEIVTHPMTREYFYRDFVPKLENGMSYLRTHGFKGHNKCGIHIHVSTGAIDNDMLKRMIVLMYSKQQKTYETWLAITQRHEAAMEHWASMSPRIFEREYEPNYQTEKSLIKRCMTTLDRDKIYNPKARSKPKLNKRRYSAINLTNSKTIEFRIFNSNIRTERIIKNAQVIFALIDFSKTNMIPSMKNYLNYIHQNKDAYKELYDFLIEKHIFIPPEQKETIKQAMEVFKTDNVKELKETLNRICIEQSLEIDDTDENEIDERNDDECALPF